MIRIMSSTLTLLLSPGPALPAASNPSGVGASPWPRRTADQAEASGHKEGTQRCEAFEDPGGCREFFHGIEELLEKP